MAELDAGKWLRLVIPFYESIRVSLYGNFYFKLHILFQVHGYMAV